MKSWRALLGTVLLVSTAATNVLAMSQDETKAKYIDSYFFYDTMKEGPEIDISAFSMQDVFKGRVTEYSAAVALYQAGFGQVNPQFPKATSYQDSLNLLSRESANLTQDQKLLILSLSGSRLSKLYSDTAKNRNTSEELFRNSVANGTEGGICGDIHKYLAGQAQALGFTDVGLHTGIWQQDKSGKDSGGHMISHFRDPKTGIYYIQNYSQVVSTGQKTVQSMLEVSTKILGPLTGFVSTAGVKGKQHGYVPQTALWIKEGIDSVAYQSMDSSVLQLHVGNYENGVSMQVIKKTGNNSYVRAFALNQQYSAEEGTYRFSGIGFSSEAAMNKTLNTVVDEVGIIAKGYAGVGRVNSPTLDSDMSWTEKDRSVMFANMQVTGTARINKTTGRVEFEKTTLDRNLKTKDGSTDTTIRAGVSQQINDDLKVDLERSFRNVHDGHYSTKTTWTTEADKVSLIFDKKIGKIYLVVKSELYLFEGVEQMSATALKNSVEASVPVGQLGEIYIAMDVAKVMSNKSGDPFYDIPASSTFKIRLETQLC